METPQSVEEAGALLGASITKCNVTSTPTIKSPKGMHSSFSIVSPVPSTELFTRLYQLRDLLNKCPKNEPLVAAPSLLAVLMKLLGVSSSLAPKYVVDARVNTPPLWSTPLRRLWVDCVVQCHLLGDALTGKARINLFGFIRTMMALAGLNPKSQKAAGGTRMAALMVIGDLFQNLPLKLSPWALDALQLCHKSLRSSGNGEPSYRIEAVRTACSVLIACRKAHMERPTSNNNAPNPLLLQGAMEDRAIVETYKIIKQATTDKFPEVRQVAANIAAIAAPLLIHQLTAPKPGDTSTAAPPTTSLDDVITLCIKNIDDESPAVAVQWAEALTRCLWTCIAWGEKIRLTSESVSRRSDREEEDDAGGDGSDKRDTLSAADPGEALRFSTRKIVGVVTTCSSIPASVNYLVEHFVKVGGELAASKCGSPFSSGGRAVRFGVSLALVKFLKLRSTLDSSSGDYNIEKILPDVLEMVGPDLVKQLSKKSSQQWDATSQSSVQSSIEKASSLFGSRTKSPADGGLARMATNRVLREGLSEVASEPSQLSMLHQLIALCQLNRDKPLNPHQLQVAWIEVSHLLSTLGSAAGSCLDDFMPTALASLSHEDHGVRHEAAVACASMATAFPNEARKLFREAVDFVQVQHAELVTQSTLEANNRDTTPKKSKSRFRKKEVKVDDSLGFQSSIHGYSLLISLLLRELPRVPGGLPSELLKMSMSVGEILVTCQDIEILTKGNANGACTCVRAGYGIVCGALTVGGHSVAPHIPLVFGLWERAKRTIEEGNKNFSFDHEVICLDAVLTCIVAFLEHCSHLLLEIPEALAKASLMLETALPLFTPNGRLFATPTNLVAVTRHESAKASLLEAYAWLPPGSFPLVANEVFAFALRHIQTATESDVMCSVLPTLVNKEDKILETQSLSRAQRYGQVGGAKDVENQCILLNSDGTDHYERESVMHFQSACLDGGFERFRPTRLWGSRILGLFAHDDDEDVPPTPLHAVGTWQKPVSPSNSSSVRLIDAAVQAFAATFGLKDGKEQQTAMIILEMMIPPVLAQLAKSMGVNSSIIETERRSKSKDENAAIANITAVLLACLKSLPIHEATHNIPIGLGPPWMNKAKDLLLTLLPSASNTVRRAAAEGLALLATLGVTEDAHTLQSSVLHSLDEVMQGNKPDGKPRTIPFEPLSAARAGSLLTLACIQRTAYNIMLLHRARSKNRSSNSESVVDAQRSSLPTVQMMTRILPSISCHSPIRDAFVVRTYAVHSFALLVAYSLASKDEDRTEEEKHLMKKAVELVEYNFLACWTAASVDLDQGQEAEKLATEASFLSAVLRTMTFLVPSLAVLEEFDADIGARFARMALLAIESHSVHPVVFSESMAFFESYAEHRSVPNTTSTEILTNDDMGTAIQYLFEGIQPERTPIFAVESWLVRNGVLSAMNAMNVAASCVLYLVNTPIAIDRVKMIAFMFALLESFCGTRMCGADTAYRSLAAPRDADLSNAKNRWLDFLIVRVLDSLVSGKNGLDSKGLLQSILLVRIFMTGSVESDGDSEMNQEEISRNTIVKNAVVQAQKVATVVLETANPCRWQVKCQGARFGADALRLLRDASVVDPDIMHSFDLAKSNAITSKLRRESVGKIPSSFVVFHLGEILAASCGAAVASVDQYELRYLQQAGANFLCEIVKSFGSIPDPDEAGVSLLEQYSSQILSAAKHSISLQNGMQPHDANELFLVGCKTMESIISKGLVNDPMVFKRMVRPLLPNLKRADIATAALDENLAQSLNRTNNGQHETTVDFSVLIGKLNAVARLIFLVRSTGISSDICSFLHEEVTSNRDSLALHFAAAARDGVRLLMRENVSLAGLSSVSDSNDIASNPTGFLFEHEDDLSESAKAILVRAWPACLCGAMILFSECVVEDGVTAARKESAQQWIKRLQAIAVCACGDSYEAFSNDTHGTISVPFWARGLPPAEATQFFVHGLRASLPAICPPSADVCAVIHFVAENILQPALEPEAQRNAASDKDLVVEACGFVESAAKYATEATPDLLITTLVPLDKFQKNELDLANDTATIIVPYFLRTLQNILQCGSGGDSLVLPLLRLSVNLVSKSKGTDDPVKRASEAILGACLGNESLPLSAQVSIAREMAQSDNWQSWSIIVASSQSALASTVSLAEEALGDVHKASRHMGALTAVCTVVQGCASDSIGGILNAIGHRIFGLLKGYGSLSIPAKDMISNRTGVCATAMKIIMTAYQGLSSSESCNLVSFLCVMFDCFVEVIRYNGLPNQSSPQATPDPSLGRMCAQAIVHVARTTPSQFKESLVSLSAQNRAILEFAVRADMSGYASTRPQAPQKKKLNLKSFTK